MNFISSKLFSKLSFKKILLFLVSFSIVIFAYLNLAILKAQTVDELKASITDLNQKIQALDREIAEFNKKISQTQGESKTLKQALSVLELKRNELFARIQSTTFKISQAEKGIEITVDKIDDTTNTIQRSHNALIEIIRGIETNQNRLPLLVQITATKFNLSDLIEEAKRSEEISNEVGEKLSNLKEAKLVLQATKVEFEVQKDSLTKLNDSLIDQKYLIEQNKAEKNRLLLETQNKESTYQKMVLDRNRKKAALEKEIGDFESRIRATVDRSKLPRYGKGVIEWPLDVVKISQYFGNTSFSTQNPQIYNGSGHNAIDLAVPSGSNVYSAQSGTVIGSGNTDTACSGVSYGKWILIRHNNGLSTLYAHLSRIDVSVGQTVGSREKVGLSGNTGYSTGPHLHFSVYASDGVHVTGPTEYRSKTCGTYMILPVAPRDAYLNPLSYL